MKKRNIVYKRKLLQFKQYLQLPWVIFLLASLIGVSAFLVFYGTDILNPLNTGWLLAGGDLSQHYLGWQFFRESPWVFPVGMISNLAYPHGIALTFMDSIPLFAIPFKVIEPFLPSNFQYFGWWGLMSFMLQAGFAALIVRRWTRSIVVPLLVATIAVASPIMLERMFMHTALGGHWVILWGVWAVCCSRTWSTKVFIATWSVLLSLAVMIHPYFLVMNVFLMGIAVVLSWSGDYRNIIKIIFPLFLAAVVTGFIGGFSISSIGGERLGTFGYNLLTPIIPMGWSAYFNEIPTVGGTRENLGYFGLGGFILVGAATGVVLWKWRNIFRLAGRCRGRLSMLAVLCIGLVVVMLSPVIQAADIVVTSYSVPGIIERIWSIFRATGRLAWPLYYLLIFGGLYLIIRTYRQRYLIAMVGLMAIGQMIDVFNSPMAIYRSVYFHSVEQKKYVSPLTSRQWEQIAVGKKHIIYLGDLYDNDFVALSEYAVRHSLTLNTGYFARKPKAALDQTINTTKEELLNGVVRKDILYISRGFTPIVVKGGVQERIDKYWVARYQ